MQKSQDFEREKKNALKRKAKKKTQKIEAEAIAKKKAKAFLQKDGKTPKESQKLKNIRTKIQKALKEGKAVKHRKVWHNVKFRRPHTLRLAKAPKYPRHAVPKKRTMDKFDILKRPLNSDSVMRCIEDQNTLVFIVALKSTKKQIRNAFKKMYDVKVEKVRTLIRPTGDKKAYIKLPKGVEAVDIGNKIGLL
jgi:large subunit ribosomal protein L23Ae